MMMANIKGFLGLNHSNIAWVEIVISKREWWLGRGKRIEWKIGISVLTFFDQLNVKLFYCLSQSTNDVSTYGLNELRVF